MSKQVVNVGAAPDDHTGDPLRTAFQKIVANFGEIYLYFGDGTDLAPVTVASGGTGLASGTSGGVLYYSAAGTLASSAALAANGVVLGGGAGAAPFTDTGLTYDATTDVLSLNKSASNTAPSLQLGSSNIGIGIGTNSDLVFFQGGAPRAALSSSGITYFGANSGWFGYGTNSYGQNSDYSMIRGGANHIVFGGGTATSSYAAGMQTTRAEINKAVTGIADATATAVFTVTIPNAAHSASIRVRLTGALGAGGAIGANESTQDAEYMINVTRTAGVNAVATIGAVVGQAAAASVAGANNAAVTATLGAIGGAVGATNTFTIQVTITKSGGASANHTCLGFAELLNANATGVTIA